MRLPIVPLAMENKFPAPVLILPVPVLDVKWPNASDAPFLIVFPLTMALSRYRRAL
jgi:hypothetical protein